MRYFSVYDRPLLFASALGVAGMAACEAPLRDFGEPAGGDAGQVGAGAGTGSGAGSGSGANASGGQGSGATSNGGNGGTSVGSGASSTGGVGTIGNGGNGGVPAIVCDADLAACDGACVDLQADAKHCGACGHDCFGGVCDLGTCQPITIAQNQSHLGGIATDGTYVYWTGDTGPGSYFVARRRVDASDAVKTLASSEAAMYGLALSSTKVYWVAAGHVRSCDLPDCDTGPSDAIATVTSGGCSSSLLFAESKQTLFWACSATYNAKDGTLWSLPLPTTTPVPIGPNPADPTLLTSDGTNLYWLNSSTYTNDFQNADGGVLRARLSDGVTTPIVSGLQGDLFGLAVGGGALYFSGGIVNNEAGAIFREPLPNGVASINPLPKFANAYRVGQMVADESYLYFTDLGSGGVGSVSRCPHDTECPMPEVIAPGEASPYAITQDAVSIYWTGVGATGPVRRLAK